MAEMKILTVSQASELIKMLLEGSPLLKRVTVKGEVSNLTVHRTGHLYFSLKDEGAVLRCVMFRTQAQNLKFRLEDGMKMLAGGRITVYAASGAYQLVCSEMIPDGIGALQLAFEQQKQKLAAEGLFDPARKRPIPKIPHTVGVITSPTGAAIRDILQISARRFPFAKVIVYPAAVQGELAPKQLLCGVETMGKEIRPDVIIIGRGGGSAEDLWAFNDEALVRAVAACPIPIISAVGHEIDVTLCDFAADLRAPTPSAAAELAFPDTEELLGKFENVNVKMLGQLSARIALYRSALTALSQSRAMQRPDEILRERKEQIALAEHRIRRAIALELEKKTAQMAKMAALLDAMSPLKVLSRGYALVLDPAHGTPIRSVHALDVDDTVELRLSDGHVRASIAAIYEDEGDKNEVE